MLNNRLVFSLPVIFGGLAALFAVQPVPQAYAQDQIDPEAEAILSGMSDYLGGLPSFTADFAVDFDVIAGTGQKLKFISSGTLSVERPGKLRVTRSGSIADVALVLNGQMLSIYGRGLNGYFQLPVETIDGAIDALRNDVGFDAPGADILSASPFNPDVTDIVSGQHIGMTKIAGEDVHHLAFRGAQVDWQIWIKDGDQPLPVQYVITSKWMTGAPEYTLRLSDWDVEPSIDASVFVFNPPADAKAFSSIAVDDAGRLIESQE